MGKKVKITGRNLFFQHVLKERFFIIVIPMHDIKKIFPSFRFLLVRLAFFSFLVFSFLTANAETSRQEIYDTLLAMSLEELMEVEVTVTTGTPKSLKLAPAVASVITSEYIEQIGAATLNEILETVPGLHVSPSGPTIFTSIWSIRGIHTSTM